MGFFHWLWPDFACLHCRSTESSSCQASAHRFGSDQACEHQTHTTSNSTQRLSILRSESCSDTYLSGQITTTIAEKGVQLRQEIAGNMQELDHHSQSRLGWALPAHSFQPLQTNIMIATFFFALKSRSRSPMLSSIIILFSPFAHLLSLLWCAPKALKCVKLLNYL